MSLILFFQYFDIHKIHIFKLSFYHDFTFYLIIIMINYEIMSIQYFFSERALLLDKKNKYIVFAY